MYPGPRYLDKHADSTRSICAAIRRMHGISWHGLFPVLWRSGTSGNGCPACSPCSVTGAWDGLVDVSRIENDRIPKDVFYEENLLLAPYLHLQWWPETWYEGQRHQPNSEGRRQWPLIAACSSWRHTVKSVLTSVWRGEKADGRRTRRKRTVPRLTSASTKAGADFICNNCNNLPLKLKTLDTCSHNQWCHSIASI